MKILESPMVINEIKLVNPKGNQPWIFIGRTDAEAPILWPPDVKSWLIGKDPDSGKDWRQDEMGTTEDKMAGWYHRLDEYEFEQTLGDSEGQGSLVCCSPWGHKESDTTEWLNNNNNVWTTWCLLLIFPQCKIDPAFLRVTWTLVCIFGLGQQKFHELDSNICSHYTRPSELSALRMFSIFLNFWIQKFSQSF